MSDIQPSLVFVKKVKGNEFDIIRLLVMSFVIAVLSYNYFKNTGSIHWQFYVLALALWLFLLVKLVMGKRNSIKDDFRWQTNGLTLYLKKQTQTYLFKDFTKVWLEKHRNYDHVALLKRRPDEADSDASIDKDLVMASVNDSGHANVYYDEDLEAIIFSFLDKSSAMNLKTYFDNKLKK